MRWLQLGASEASFDIDFTAADLRDISPMYGVDLSAARWPSTHRLLLDTAAFLKTHRARVDASAQASVDALLAILSTDDQPQWALSARDLRHVAPEICEDLWQAILQHTHPLGKANPNRDQ